MPEWVREAYDDYVTRLGSSLKITLTQIEPGSRSGGRAGDSAMRTEGQRLLAAVRKDDYVVVLDERGSEMTTRELAAWLSTRMQEGQDLAFLIGGPDGLAAEVLARGNLRWSLSRLTLPHALVRVVLAEQLYRAHGVLANHPYHRD
jgi:23S rRNA (pseudouridine1915-N3)-methyltransferase